MNFRLVAPETMKYLCLKKKHIYVLFFSIYCSVICGRNIIVFHCIMCVYVLLGKDNTVRFASAPIWWGKQSGASTVRKQSRYTKSRILLLQVLEKMDLAGSSLSGAANMAAPPPPPPPPALAAPRPAAPPPPDKNDVGASLSLSHAPHIITRPQNFFPARAASDEQTNVPGAPEYLKVQVTNLNYIVYQASPMRTRARSSKPCLVLVVIMQRVLAEAQVYVPG